MLQTHIWIINACNIITCIFVLTLCLRVFICRTDARRSRPEPRLIYAMFRHHLRGQYLITLPDSKVHPLVFCEYQRTKTSISVSAKPVKTHFWESAFLWLVIWYFTQYLNVLKTKGEVTGSAQFSQKSRSHWIIDYGCCCNLHGENWFGTNGFSLVQKRSVLLTETPQQPNLLFLLLPWNPPSSLSPFAPPLSQRRRLHLFCILASPLLLLFWAASSLRQTAPFMKIVTCAYLKRPGDAASRTPTAQVPWDIKGCLAFSSFSINLSRAFLGFFFFCLDCKIEPFRAFFQVLSSPWAVIEPWVRASTAVSSLLIRTTNLKRWVHDMFVCFLLVISACVCVFVFQQVYTVCGSATSVL